MSRLAKVLLLLGLMVLATIAAGADKPEGKSDFVTSGVLDCTNAIPLACNSTVTGSNSGAPANVTTYSCSSWNESGGEVVYTLDLTTYTDLSLTLSGMTADLDIFLLTACDELTCTAYGNTTVSGEINPGSYYVVVDGYNGATSDYTLTVTCADVPPPPEEDGSICRFGAVCYDWDFAQGNQGFTAVGCTQPVSVPAWQYGLESTVPGSPGNVWATVLNGNYPNSAADGLLSPAFTVTPECAWMEIKHYVFTEGYVSGSGNIYDGGNVTVNDVVIPPVEGYTGVVNVGTAGCVLGEEVFAGDITAGVPIRTWGKSCFDLSAFIGQTIHIRFDFGSDASVARPGWYLAYVRIGSADQPVPVEETNWGSLKSSFR